MDSKRIESGGAHDTAIDVPMHDERRDPERRAGFDRRHRLPGAKKRMAIRKTSTGIQLEMPTRVLTLLITIMSVLAAFGTAGAIVYHKIDLLNGAAQRSELHPLYDSVAAIRLADRRRDSLIVEYFETTRAILCYQNHNPIGFCPAARAIGRP